MFVCSLMVSINQYSFCSERFFYRNSRSKTGLKLQEFHLGKVAVGYFGQERDVMPFTFASSA
jgi:hypothetical protein